MLIMEPTLKNIEMLAEELTFKEIGGLFDKTDHWAYVTFHNINSNCSGVVI